jgi:hypothetical protein
MTEEEKEIKEIERSLKIQKIEAILGDLKTGLTLFQGQIDKVQKHLEDLKSLSVQDEPIKPEVDPKQIPLFTESPKRIPTVRRIDSGEEITEPPSPYNIQVVGLGTTKLDF